ncbi:Hypothetical protein CINCED_3A002257 [Cinara cedri]|uniref:Uncharacterized protein n=1 Tax=Cinara cedri TaxID=506608 RepID=A0A5E4M020_9HEMI|nr:Hypothetical protein CINCED_3A002257 [Cinara cedri]
MHKSFAKLYLFALIAWAVEKSECKQGACLSYGHSCWGAHGKRDADATNGPLFLYRLALLQQKSAAAAGADSDSSVDRNPQQASQGEGLSPPLPQDYFNIWKAYAERNAMKKNNDELPNAWNIRSSEYAPNGGYYDTESVDPRTAYKLMNL